jgi:NAD-dependent deacetylase
MDYTPHLETASAKLRGAKSVLVFTGAGVSAESGLPTFRSGGDAMWRNEDIRNYAYPAGYRRHVPKSWQWYAQRAAAALKVEPNPAHRAIAALEARVPEFLLVTQNIDNLHQRAGSTKVVELHGNLRRVYCFDCGAMSDWPDPIGEPECADCGGLLRPDVVMFEEMLPYEALERAQEAARDCDLLISAGTSNQVWPAAEIPQIALRGRGHVLVVNPDMDGQPAGGKVIQLAGPAGDVLPVLLDVAWPGGLS